MLKKKRLGQFYTTNCKYILKDLNIPAYIQNIIEPFAGNGDLLNFVRKKNVEMERNVAKKIIWNK